jgi:hypothetical protein
MDGFTMGQKPMDRKIKCDRNILDFGDKGFYF